MTLSWYAHLSVSPKNKARELVVEHGKTRATEIAKRNQASRRAKTREYWQSVEACITEPRDLVAG